MRTKRFMRIVSILLLLCFVLPISVFASTPSDDDTIEIAPTALDKKIETLLCERARILNELFAEEKSGFLNELLFSLNEIDLSLSKLGVQFLTDSQVNQMFPETKSNKALALSGQTHISSEANIVQPRADVPESTLNTWVTYRSTYALNGERYDLQRLTAQPCSPSSPLANVASRIITIDNNWQAGALNALNTSAKALISGATSNIPGANVILSFYDAVRSYVSGISSTTEVNVPHITYSWSNVTTAVFVYVRLSSQTDYYQWLSLVSTKTETAVSYAIPSFTSGTGATLSPIIINGSRTITATPDRYNDSGLAVSNYTSGNNGAIKNCVNYIQISGPESKSIQRISPCQPSFPIHCEN